MREGTTRKSFLKMKIILSSLQFADTVIVGEICGNYIHDDESTFFTKLGTALN